MKVGRARSLAAACLKNACVESPNFETDLLLEWASGFSRAFLHAHPETDLSAEACAQFQGAIERRCSREPLQHITGEAGFFGLSLEAARGALVPRPETEILVETALENFTGGFFIDWGTGSGCIAAAILVNRPRAFCVAVDRSPGALQVAWRNLKKHGLLSRTLLWHGKEPWKVPVKPGSADLVASNPPYIPDSRILSLMPEVRLHDPREALSGGSDGLEAYRILLPWAFHVLKSGGALVLEIGGQKQEREVRNLTGSFRFAGTLRDYQGHSRVLVLKKERV
ncbi:MAG: peptide chain release factor N(5)-glutamine methyltransferase [Thermovirgaceae bacterium]